MYEIGAIVVFIALSWALWKNWKAEKLICELQSKLYRMNQLFCPKCGEEDTIEYYDCWQSYQCKECDHWWQKPIMVSFEGE